MIIDLLTTDQWFMLGLGAAVFISAVLGYIAGLFMDDED